MKNKALLCFGLLLIAVALIAQTGGFGPAEINPPGRQPGGVNLAGTSTFGGIKMISNGVTFTRFGVLSAALSPAQVSANTCAEQTFTVTGVSTGDIVTVNKPTAQAGLGIAGVRASAANQVGINFCNTTGAGITPTASQTYLFTVMQ